MVYSSVIDGFGKVGRIDEAYLILDEGEEEINYNRPKRNQYVSRIRNRVY